MRHNLTAPNTGDAGQSTALRMLTWVVRGLVALLLLALIVPWAPRLPDTGLDPSWATAMQEALARGMHIGQDIIFTFGPYASLYTFIYNPQTDLLSLVSGIGFGLLYSLLLLMHYRRTPALTTLLVSAVFCWILANNKDSLLFSYPLLLALTLFTCLDETRGNTVLRRAFALCIAALGLLPLIKGSLLPLCLGVSLLCAAYAWQQRDRGMSAAFLLIPPISSVVLWLAAGQPVASYPAYFHNILPIISGYTNAMATHDDKAPVLTYVLVAALVLASVLARRRSWPRTLFLFAIFAAYLFLSFKAAFVRVDHATIALASLLAAILLLANHTPRALWLLCVSGGIFMTTQIDKHSIPDAQHIFVYRYATAIDGLVSRIRNPGGLESAYRNKLQQISREHPITSLPGTSDIYPWDITELLASANKWAPRPVIQSYSAYTPSLAAANEAHLRAENAPDNLFIRVASIDGRIPSLDDGLSWPTVLQNYVPTAITGDYLIFQRQQRSPVEWDSAKRVSRSARLGERIEVPQPTELLFTRITLKPTLIGRLTQFLYKNQSLTIKLTLSDGAQREFRLIPAMAESGFILSPLVENTLDLALLANGHMPALREKAVTHFSITADATGRDWQDNIRIDFVPLPVPAGKSTVEGLFAATTQPSAAMQRAIRNIRCEGNLDSINGMPVNTASVLGSIIEVNGWTVLSSQEGTLPAQVFITLRSASGELRIYPATATQRPDVSSYFHNPQLAQSGFTARIDAHLLSGRYQVGVLRSNGSEFEQCQWQDEAVPINLTERQATR